MARLHAQRQHGLSKIRLLVIATVVGASALAAFNVSHYSVRADLSTSRQATDPVYSKQAAPQGTSSRSAVGSAPTEPSAVAAAAAALSPEDVLDRTTCLEKCCWTQKRIEWAYGGEKGRRPGLNDRLSTVDSKMLGDVVFGELPKPDWFQGAYTPLTMEILPCLQPGTVIFVENEYINPFFQTMHPHIPVEYVLISGDSDSKSPEGAANFIDDEKIIHWFGMNCNPPTPSQLLTRFTCIPNGVSQWDLSREHMNEAVEKGMGLVQQRLLNLDLQRRTDKLFLASFVVATNPTERQKTWDHFCEGPMANLSTCFYDHGPAGNRNRGDYYKGIMEHMFTISPPGAGLDGYRSWEVLYLGGFPIVRKSSIDEAYTGLPVWIIDRWEDITIEKAKIVFEAFLAKQWDFSRLYKGYWQRRIFDLRHGYLKAKKIEYMVKSDAG